MSTKRVFDDKTPVSKYDSDSRIIAEQAREIIYLRKCVETLQQQETNHRNWLSERKRQLGVSDNVSFDIVCEQLIKFWKDNHKGEEK
jgi:hypothetical protein